MAKLRVDSCNYDAIVVETYDDVRGVWHVPAWYERGWEYAELAGQNGDCTFPTVAEAEAAIADCRANIDWLMGKHA